VRLLTLTLCCASLGTTPFVFPLPAMAASTPGPAVVSVVPSSGSAEGGEKVTIAGSGLAQATGVWFGSLPASFVIRGDQRIVATTPPGDAGRSVDVTVTAGRSKARSARTKADSFAYRPAYAPRISAVTPNVGKAAGGTIVTIFGTGLSETRLIRFGKTDTRRFVVKSDREILVASPAGPVGSSVHLTVFATRGSSSWTAADRFTFVAGATTRAPPAGRKARTAGPVAPLATSTVPTVTAIDPNFGPPNGQTQVTIWGTGLSQVTTVNFGAIGCVQFFAVSDTQIFAFSPPGTVGQTVHVTVTSAGGTSSTSAADQFTYVSPQPAEVDGITPNSGSAAGGTPVTIRGKGLSNVAIVKFGNGAAFNVFPQDDSTIQVTTPSQGTNPSLVDVTVTTTAGATSASGLADTFHYQAAAAPIVNGIESNHGPSTDRTHVTVYGSGLMGASTVKFNSTPGTDLFVEDDTTLFVTSPVQGANPATVDVTVVTPVAASALTNADKFTYESPGPPVISGIDPASGATAGGTTVQIFGSGLSAVTAVKFGAVAASTVFTGDNFISVTSPPQGTSPATVDITVSTASATSAMNVADRFTYLAPTQPLIYAVDPNQGTTGGGQVVFLTGKGFGGATAVSFGGVTATSFHVDDDNSMTATSPAHVAGTVDIAVSGPAGVSPTGSAADQFTYGAPSTPTVSALDPNRGPASGGVWVYVYGSGFAGDGGTPPPAPTVTFGTTAATAAAIYTDTTLAAFAPSGAVGAPVHVTVTTIAGTSSTSAADLFTYFSTPVPGISAVSPAGGPAAGGTTVYISGGGFTNTTQVVFGAHGATTIAVVNDGLIRATSPSGTGGTSVDVIVTTPGGTATAPSAFAYSAAAPPTPAVTAVGPNSGPASGGGTVYISGSGFTGATGVAFGTTSPSAFTVIDDNLIEDYGPNGPGNSAMSSTVDVQVTTPGGTSAITTADHYMFTAVPAPTVTFVSPNIGPMGGGTIVYITGTNFQTGSTVMFGATAGTNVVVLSNTLLYVTSPAQGANSATVHVTVSTGSGTSATGSADQFTWGTPTARTGPFIDGISINQGPTAGQTQVSIYGSGFTGATAVKFGTTLASGYSVFLDGQMSATSPAGSAGTVEITVTAGGSTSSTSLADRFTYVAPGPAAVYGLHPNHGSSFGGTNVTIYGKDFYGATQVTFGTSAASAVLVGFGGNSVTATAPAQGGNPAAVHVAVTTPTGQTSAGPADLFTYGPPPQPAIDAISPNSGPTYGGASVTVYGRGLTGASAVRFGTVSVPVFSFGVSSDDFVAVLNPYAAPGTVDVTITTPGGTSAASAADRFTFVTPSSPLVTAVSPTSAPASGGSGFFFNFSANTIYVSGSGLTGAFSVNFGTACSPNVSTISDTLVAVYSIPAGAANTTVDVTVSTPSGTSPTGPNDKFTFLPTPMPVITAVAPNSGGAEGGTSVWITGQHLGPVTSVSFGTTAPLPVGANSDNLLVVRSPAGTASPTPVDITATSAGGTSATNAADKFTYTAGTAPTVTYVSPNSGPAGGGAVVFVTGTGFQSATTLTIGGVQPPPGCFGGGGPGFVFNPPCWSSISNTLIFVGLTPAGTANTTVDVLVTNAVGSSAISAADHYTYTPQPAAMVSAVSPNTGPSGGGTITFVSGRNFLRTSTIKFGATAVDPAKVSFFGDDLLQVTAPPQGTNISTVDVTVDASTTSAADRFTYQATPLPVVQIVSPSSGPAGTRVFLTGSGLLSTTQVHFGTAAGLNVSALSDTLAAATAPAKPSGAVQVPVTATTIGGTSTAGASDQYTYSSGPVVTIVSPNSGPTAGGTTVTVTGSGFTGVTAVRFGTTPGTNLSVGSDGQLTVTSPAGFGTVDVAVTTASATSPLTPGDQFWYGDTYVNSSRTQYLLNSSDGTTWQDIDPNGGLSLTISAPADSTAVLSANVDLWTTQPGYNQDVGIYVAESDATQFPGHIVAWKESGGFAGTYSPNAAFVQTAFSMTGGTTYHLKLQWKANKNTGTSGEIIVAGAGDWPSSSGKFSPTAITAQLIPVSSAGIQTAVSRQQYLLQANDGKTWQDIDATNLVTTVTPTASGNMIISGNADLWTTQSGYNQDIGLYVQEADTTQYPGAIVAWKESGGFAGTFSPNAAFVQTVFPVTANTTYHVKLRWKSNHNMAANETVVAGAGDWPASSGKFSPTRLTVVLVAGNLSSAVSTAQFLLQANDGNTWKDIDATNLALTLAPGTSCLAIISGNVDLWTTQAGYNQDIGLYVQEANATQYPGGIVAWKESGGFAGTFSPNAAAVQAVFPVTGGTTYHVSLRWKSNKNMAANETVVAGAGDWPTGSGKFSPTRLTARLVSCS